MIYTSEKHQTIKKKLNDTNFESICKNKLRISGLIHGLIKMHLVKYTKGMDTIRRLIKNNLLNEKPDKQDKRAKLLMLTVEGENVLEKANKRIEEARTIFLSCISPNK